MNRYNIDRLSDPTADAALYNIAKEQKRRQRAARSEMVYICSPYRGATETEVADNVRLAIKYCQMAVKQGYLPIAPHIYLTRFLDDNNPDERNLGLSLGLELLGRCKELWICGERISEGMRDEVSEAVRLGITVNYFSEEVAE